MINRRNFLLGTAAVAVAGGVAACSSASGGSTAATGAGATTELTLFHRWPMEPKNGYFESLVKKFTAANPGISVKIDKVINDTYKDKVRVSVGSPQAPDVFFSWSGSFAASLVATGNVLELDDILTKDAAFKSQFVANQLPPFQVGGKQVGLPIGMIGKFWFYNKKLFADQGVTPPQTWQELVDAAAKFKAAGILPIAYGSKDQWTIAHYVGTLNQRILDPAVTKKDYEPKTGEFTDPGYVDALQRFADLLPYMTPTPNAVAHQQARDGFIAGKAAMMYLEGAEYDYFKGSSLEWGTFNFPSMPGGKGDQSQLTGAPEGFMIAKNSKHPEEAVKLFKFLLSEAMGVEWTNQTGELTAIKGGVDRSSAPDSVKEMANNIAASSEMTPWLDNALDQRLVSTYLSETQLLLGVQKTPTDVMQAVQATAKKVRG